MPGENKRVSGAQKLQARPELDPERGPEGGPKPVEKHKPYGFTQSVSDVPAKTRHADGVNPPRSGAVDEELEPPQEVRPREMMGTQRT